MEVSLVEDGTDLKIAKMTITFRSDRKHALVLGNEHPFGITKPDGLEFVVCPLEADIWSGLDPSKCYLGRIQKTPPGFFSSLLSKSADTITITLRRPTEVFTFSIKNSDGGVLTDDVARNLKDQYEFVLDPANSTTKR
jgi:hypothetical protein